MCVCGVRLGEDCSDFFRCWQNEIVRASGKCTVWSSDQITVGCWLTRFWLKKKIYNDTCGLFKEVNIRNWHRYLNSISCAFFDRNYTNAIITQSNIEYVGCRYMLRNL